MIEVDGLSKIYPNGKGVFDVSFSVAEGEALGFLGPNGAGKTTTIRVLLGFTNATKGACRVNGLDCRKATVEIHKTLGYVPGEMSFLDYMTGNQFLNLIAEMHGTKNARRRSGLIERLDLDAGQRIRRMSKGMKQKVGLIAALAHDPPVLILDEPTSGLDPLMQRRFIELINEERGRGKTVLMSSHQFDEVDRTCQRAVIIRQGHIVATEEIASLKASLRRSYIVTVGSTSDVETIKASGIAHRILSATTVEIFVGSDYARMLSTLATCQVTGLESTSQSLEQVFIQYYGQEVQ